MEAVVETGRERDGRCGIPGGRWEEGREGGRGLQGRGQHFVRRRRAGGGGGEEEEEKRVAVEGKRDTRGLFLLV